MIDTHAHIDFEEYDKDREEILNKAKSEGLEYVIIPAVEPKNFLRIIDLTNKYDEIFCGIGIHPHNALDAGKEEMELVEKLCNEKKVVAVGEIGLDYYYDFAPSEVQKAVFRQHLQIAKKHSLPAIVHNREADSDILKIIEEEQDGTLSGVLHCFSSSLDVMRKALELNFNISFTGNITFKKTNLKEIVEAVPMDKFILETDSPFMTPVPFRGKRNEPANVKKIAEKIAEIKSISTDEVISMTTRTAKQLFKLLIILFIPVIMISSSFAQTTKDNADTKTTPEEDIYYNPFKKFIGFGPLLGFNTIVSTYTLPGNNQTDVSFDGIVTYGGTVTYGLLDFCQLEASYLYFKNTKIQQTGRTVDNLQDSILIYPNTYNFFEFSANWIANPYSPVNFFASTGLNFIFSSINRVPNNQTGLTFGIGFIVNVPTKLGLFNLSASWKLDFDLQRVDALYLPQHRSPTDVPTKATSTTFYSIPRVGLLWYPKF